MRKGQKQELVIPWGGLEQLDAFHEVFSHNMGDLDTPVFHRQLFSSIL